MALLLSDNYVRCNCGNGHFVQSYSGTLELVNSSIKGPEYSFEDRDEVYICTSCYAIYVKSELDKRKLKEDSLLPPSIRHLKVEVSN